MNTNTGKEIKNWPTDQESRKAYINWIDKSPVSAEFPEAVWNAAIKWFKSKLESKPETIQEFNKRIQQHLESLNDPKLESKEPAEGEVKWIYNRMPPKPEKWPVNYYCIVKPSNLGTYKRTALLGCDGNWIDDSKIVAWLNDLPTPPEQPVKSAEDEERKIYLSFANWLTRQGLSTDAANQFKLFMLDYRKK